MDLGDWSIRNWRPLAGLTSAVLVVLGGLAGAITDYNSYFPALGGPNGLLYDVTLKVAQPWRRNIPTVPAVFVAIDDASLSTPELAALPRALFQPVWARLIDGLLEAGARRIAFDVVFAYAGADFQVGSFTLPDYDRSLIDSLDRARDRIVLGRFPSVPPAPPFLKAVGASRVGVLDLQLESDGRVRSTAPLIRLADGRIALGFAALAAGLNVRQASAAQRILMSPICPDDGYADIQSGDLARLPVIGRKGWSWFVDSSKAESWLWARRCLAKTSTAGRPVSWGADVSLRPRTGARRAAGCSNGQIPTTRQGR